MTTLNEAIKRFESNAEFEKRNGNLQGCLEFGQLTEWLKDYKRLLEQEPCEDAVDRADAQTEIMMFAGNEKYNNEIYIKVSDAVQLLRELPSVQPKTECDHPDKCHECDKILTCTYYKENK